MSWAAILARAPCCSFPGFKQPVGERRESTAQNLSIGIVPFANAPSELRST